MNKITGSEIVENRHLSRDNRNNLLIRALRELGQVYFLIGRYKDAIDILQKFYKNQRTTVLKKVKSVEAFFMKVENEQSNHRVNNQPSMGIDNDRRNKTSSTIKIEFE